jgi:hypothetical protein
MLGLVHGRRIALGLAVTAVLAATALWAQAGGAASGRATGACQITQAKSLAGKVPTTVKFVNKTAGTVQLYWLSYVGTLVYYYTVPAGKTLPVKTFATSPWLALNSSFVCVGYVIAPRATYVIG